jgi:hypothetical protein
MRIKIILLCFTSLLFSCVYSSFIPESSEALPPYPGNVSILYKEPDREYMTLGTIVARSEDLTLTDALMELQRKTASIGGNAVIMRDRATQTGGAVITPIPALGVITSSSSMVHEVVGTAIFIGSAEMLNELRERHFADMTARAAREKKTNERMPFVYILATLGIVGFIAFGAFVVDQ